MLSSYFEIPIQMKRKKLDKTITMSVCLSSLGMWNCFGYFADVMDCEIMIINRHQAKEKKYPKCYQSIYKSGQTFFSIGYKISIP